MGMPSCAGAILAIDKDNVRILLNHQQRKQKKPKCDKLVPHHSGIPIPTTTTNLEVKKPHLKCAGPGISFAAPDPFLPGKIKALSFRMTEYHWHSPSEHTVDGGYFPMEMHLIMPGKRTSLTIAVFMTTDASLETNCKDQSFRGKEKLECMRAKFFHALMNSLPPIVKEANATGFVKYPEKFHEMDAVEIPAAGDVRMMCQTQPYEAGSLLPPETVCVNKTFDEYRAFVESVSSCPSCTKPTLEDIVMSWSELDFPEPPPEDLHTACQFLPIEGELERIEVPVYADDLPERGQFHADEWPFRTVDPFSYFVPDMPYFYYYRGSQTTPPCSPTMEWILNPFVVTVFPTSVELYRKVLSEFPHNRLGTRPMPSWSPLAKNPVAFTTLASNNRPLQEMHPPPGTHAARWGIPKREKNCIRDSIGVCIHGTEAPEEPRSFWRVNNISGLSGQPIHYLDSSPAWASFTGDDPIGKIVESSVGSGVSGSSASGESDSSGSSMKGLKIMGSGSSGFYMALWKWFLLGVCCISCCFTCCLVHSCIHATSRHQRHLEKIEDAAKEDTEKGTE
jgi:carbonic anhydrase